MVFGFKCWVLGVKEKPAGAETLHLSPFFFASFAYFAVKKALSNTAHNANPLPENGAAGVLALFHLFPFSHVPRTLKGRPIPLANKVIIMTTQDSTVASIQNVLENFPEVHIATLFGSAAQDRMTATSDIDIAIACKKPLSSKEKISLSAALETAVQRNIDLIDLQQVSGPILQQALCTGRIILKKSTPLLADLLKKMWYNQADMMPHTVMIMRKQIQRFTHE